MPDLFLFNSILVLPSRYWGYVGQEGEGVTCISTRDSFTLIVTLAEQHNYLLQFI